MIESVDMKTILFCVICNLLCVLSLKAQGKDSTEIRFEPINFMGVPMIGAIDDFQALIESKGFTFETESNYNCRVLTGNFIGKKVLVLLEPSSKGDIYRSGIVFTDGGLRFTSWDSILQVYNTVKRLLTEKYGKPKSMKENFKCFPYPENKEEKLIELANGNCEYVCMFEIRGKVSSSNLELDGVQIGSVELHISDDRTVVLNYLGFVNDLDEERSRLDNL